MTGHILVVDDDKSALANLSLALRRSGHQVRTADSGEAACELIHKHAFDVVLTDLKMPGQDGLAVLRCCRDRLPEAETIVMTAFADLDSAVAAMKRGAYHYLAKPLRLDAVRAVVSEALDKVRLKSENRRLRESLESASGQANIITGDPAMKGILDLARRVAPTGCHVLITGESGTGKELFARYLHAHSGRSSSPFLAVNCGALHEELLANELFGHDRGAFTGATGGKPGLIEAASGGTLFLDEVTEMSPGMQVKLLRVVQEGELMRLGGTTPIQVDVRYLAATNRDIPTAIEAGHFRQDLYYRLNVVNFHVPPLRARKDDIPLLADYFLRRVCVSMRKDVRAIAPGAMECLVAHDYPGNVRELLNLIERGVAVTAGDRIEPEHLPAGICRATGHAGTERQEDGRIATLAEHEAGYIRWVLDQAGGNQTKAARQLGINRVSLWRKLKGDPHPEE